MHGCGWPARARLGATCPSGGENRRVVYQRYAHWCDKGRFERLFQGVQQLDMQER